MKMEEPRLMPRPFICAALMCAAFLLMGCGESGRSGLTLDEPDITEEYLAGEYAAQLTRDGAEYIFGTIGIISEEGGVAMVTIAAKQYVDDPGSPNGYYIADRNLEYTFALSPWARATFLPNGETVAKVMEPEEFARAVWDDFEKYGKRDPEYSQRKLYHIYVIGESIELLLARYLP